MKFYPALPLHEQIRRPFQTPPEIEMPKDEKPKGGRPTASKKPNRVKVIELLEDGTWRTRMEIADCLDCSCKSLKEILLNKARSRELIRRITGSGHEYEYTLPKFGE